MQVKKESVRTKMLEVARGHFLAKGFANASMREIAKETGQSLGNIYNYFEDKAHLCREALEFDLAKAEKDALQAVLEEARQVQTRSVLNAGVTTFDA